MEKQGALNSGMKELMEELSSDELPPGWTVAWSKTHKKKYYWNASTEETQWTPPGLY